MSDTRLSADKTEDHGHPHLAGNGDVTVQPAAVQSHSYSRHVFQL
jgi:hypothetical protein